MDFFPDKTRSANDMQIVCMADLLDRPEMRLDNGHFRAGIEGKKILITGAAGSIGSELARQLALFAPEALVLVDCNESRLADISEELKKDCREKTSIRPYPRNISVQSGMDDLMARERPDWVFHAAALKHVPFLEEHLVDAALANIVGTKMVADASVAVGVKKFVFLSTDKAVYPSSVMGLTKRFCERMLVSSENAKTQFVIARLVNVLGSRGSVVPRFEKQLRYGYADITHPEAERYFITPFEATQLLLESMLTGKHGETLRFEMDRAQNITKLALKLAACLGKAPDEVQINYTQMRSGEKLTEVLQYPDEPETCSQSPHIRKSVQAKMRRSLTDHTIAEVLKTCTYATQDSLRTVLEEAIPEYRKVME